MRNIVEFARQKTKKKEEHLCNKNCSTIYANTIFVYALNVISARQGHLKIIRNG